MARLKVGEFFVDASGKLGGHQIGRNSGQLVLSNKSICKRKPSVLQSNQRKQTQFIMASWQLLTDSQRLLWSENAKTYTRRDKFYDKRIINGFQLFNVVNQNRLQLGLYLLTTPAIHDVPNPPQVIKVTATSTDLILTSESYESKTIIIIYATPLLSRGITNPRKLLRILTYLTPTQLATGYDLYAVYTAKYGAISDGDNFFIGIKTVSNVSYYSPKGITINRPIVVVNSASDPILISGLVTYLLPSSIDPTAVNNGDNVNSWVDVISANDASPGDTPTMHLDSVTGNRTVRFNGTSNWLTLGQPSNLNFIPSTDPFTIVFRFGENVNPANLFYIISKATTTAASRQFNVAYASGSWLLYIGGVISSHGSTTPIANMLVFVVVSTTSVYCIFDAVQSTPGSIGTATNSQEVTLARRAQTPATPSEVDLDFVAFYNKELSPSEIAAIQAVYKIN